MRLIILFALAACCVAQDQPPDYHVPTCAAGRTVIVHLFNWKWSDIAAECERFLGPKGFCGVQVSPPNEHRDIYPGQDPQGGDRPWWERYQPVSYILESRSGSRSQFQNMVERCNDVGVRIYVDAIINHMGRANVGSGIGSGGSSYNSDSGDFPGVPYSQSDFNCCWCSRCDSGTCNIENWGDRVQIRNCRLLDLWDLDPGQESVQDKIAGFLNDLIGIGVAGFRIDACKHMWAGDLEQIYARMNGLNTRWWPEGTKPFFFNEIIVDPPGATAEEYQHLGRVTEFKYSREIYRPFKRLTELKYLVNWGEDWGMMQSDIALVFVDNHDNQRGHGAGGTILTFKDSRAYKMATAFKLAHPYGFTRIMSSYYFDGGDDGRGPPEVDNAERSIADVPINPDGTCGGGWICEHRWRQITNMAQFRNVADGEPQANWWDNDNNQIAFSRGNKAFIVINNEEFDNLNTNIQTGLPAGTYCDVISGDLEGGSCTGKSVEVGSDGEAHFSISSSDEDPVIAIHIESRLS